MSKVAELDKGRHPSGKIVESRMASVGSGGKIILWDIRLNRNIGKAEVQSSMVAFTSDLRVGRLFCWRWGCNKES